MFVQRKGCVRSSKLMLDNLGMVLAPGSDGTLERFWESYNSLYNKPQSLGCMKANMVIPGHSRKCSQE